MNGKFAAGARRLQGPPKVCISHPAQVGLQFDPCNNPPLSGYFYAGINCRVTWLDDLVIRAWQQHLTPIDWTDTILSITDVGPPAIRYELRWTLDCANRLITWHVQISDSDDHFAAWTWAVIPWQVSGNYGVSQNQYIASATPDAIGFCLATQNFIADA